MQGYAARRYLANIYERQARIISSQMPCIEHCGRCLATALRSRISMWIQLVQWAKQRMVFIRNPKGHMLGVLEGWFEASFGTPVNPMTYSLQFYIEVCTLVSSTFQNTYQNGQAMIKTASFEIQVVLTRESSTSTQAKPAPTRTFMCQINGFVCLLYKCNGKC